MASHKPKPLFWGKLGSMCELFALSSQLPTRLTLSLERFAAHGGREGPHRDGWGIAFYEGRDARVIREPAPASDSPCVELLHRHGFHSDLVVSHIRLATQGQPGLANTQPFSRELGGRLHLFAHNGDLDAIDRQFANPSRYRRIGDTDSEYAFCLLLERLAPLWSDDRTPDLSQRLSSLRQFAAELRPLGPANFLYSDGDYLFAHGDRRTQPGREGYHPPGLWWLQRSCQAADQGPEIAGLSLDGSERQSVLLVASVPLTDEPWQPFDEGEILVARHGMIRHP